MDATWNARTALLLGAEGMERVSRSHVVVVGTGGVGAAAAEMLVRAGIGHLCLIDNDLVALSNINRQLPALHSTVGRSKVEVLRERLTDINPELDLVVQAAYLEEGNVAQMLDAWERQPDFVVDAIDTVSPKVALIQHCLAAGIPLVSSMGSGAKFDATRVRVADISRTRMCPLAHMLRKRLHKLGIYEGFLAVYSEEEPRTDSIVIEESRNKKSQAGTISYMPAVFGCVCAQAVLGRIAGINEID